MRAVAATAQKYMWECPECDSRYFSEPLTLGVRNGALVRIESECPKCFEKCPKGHAFGYLEYCECGKRRKRIRLIKREIDPDDPTFGLTSTGSTNYPTSTNTIGGTTVNVATQSGYIFGWAIVASASGTIKTIGMNLKTAAGNIRLALYSTYSGGKFSGLLGQSASTTAVAGWNDLPIGAVSVVKDATYYIVAQLDNNTAAAYYIASGTRIYGTFTYGAFPDPTGSLSEQANILFNMRITYVQIKGYIKLTKATLSEGAASVTSMSFYSHATGNFYVGIYTDSSGPAVLKWASGSIPATGGGAWDTVLISAGTPNTLALAAGAYWLAWQWDSVNAGPSYAAGGANTGAYLAQAYGAFPDPMTGETLSTENWSQYATYVQYAISGITRDGSGDPLGSCTVWLFKSSDKSYQQITTSDADTGAYTFYVADNTTEYFTRAYKDGTPNVFGTTDRDLVGQ